MALFQAVLVLWVYETVWSTREGVGGGGDTVEATDEFELGAQQLCVMGRNPVELEGEEDQKMRVGEDERVGAVARWVELGASASFSAGSTRD